MNILDVKQILSDRDFKKSNFFCAKDPLMEDSEYKELITEIYSLYLESQAESKYFFENGIVSSHIFSFADTPNNLANFCLVSKRWHLNVTVFVRGKWNLLLNAKNLPFLSAKASGINLQFLHKLELSKYGVLSKYLGVPLGNKSISVNNLGKYEQPLVHATKAMWSRLRPQLERLVNISLPTLDETADKIDQFLQQCLHLDKIKQLNLSNLQLSIAPAGLKLFTRLVMLNLEDNRFIELTIPKECLGLELICLEDNQFPDLKLLEGCSRLQTTNPDIWINNPNHPRLLELLRPYLNRGE